MDKCGYLLDPALLIVLAGVLVGAPGLQKLPEASTRPLNSGYLSTKRK